MNKKIIKLIVIVFFATIITLVGLTVLLNVIVKSPSTFEICYEGETFFCIDEVKHTFHIQTHPGSGNPGASGFYYYNTITKTINGIIEKDDDLYTYSLSNSKYKVIFQDKNFFVYQNKYNYLDILRNDDYKTIKSNKNIKGLYESSDKSLSIYILENDKYIVYNSKTKISKYINIDELIEYYYYVDASNKKVYNIKNHEIIELSYKGEDIPIYYNMDAIKKYDSNKKDLVGYFKVHDVKRTNEEYSVEDSKISVFYDGITRKFPLTIISWDSNYIYFDEYDLRYNVLKNKYEIDDYIEVQKEELEKIK